MKHPDHTDINAITDTQIIPYVPAVQGKDKAKQAAKQLQQVFSNSLIIYHVTFFLLNVEMHKWLKQICIKLKI